MIGRMWRGWAKPENAAKYETLLREDIFPGIAAKNVDGYREIQLFRRAVRHGTIEFTTIMWFESWDAVKEFAGEDFETAYVPAKAREVLDHWDDHSRHYEVKERVTYQVMETLCRTEITELHHFFVAWMTGALPRTAKAFARAADVLADDMTMINPEGEVMACGPLLGAIETAHGAFTPPEQTLRIWIKNFDCRFVSGDLCLATYEEWQDRTGEVKGRLSTVLFRRRDGPPNGVEWLHVHETWLPEGSGGS